MDEAAIECPGCKGKGQTWCHVHHRDRSKSGYQWMPCLTCEGKKTITAEHQARLDAGKRLRDRRKQEPYRHADAEAESLGISKYVYGDAEWGRLPLAEIEAILAMPRKEGAK